MTRSFRISALALVWCLLLGGALGPAALAQEEADVDQVVVDEQAPAEEMALEEAPPEETPAEQAPMDATGGVVNVWFSKPLITKFQMPSIPSMPSMPDTPNMLPMPSGASPLSQGGFAAKQMTPPRQPDCPTGTEGAASGDGGQPAGPVAPPTFMLTELTNQGDQLQTYRVSASQVSTGANLSQSIAMLVAPGKSAILMFVIPDGTPVPSPDDVAFSAEAIDLPPMPCLDHPLTVPNIDFGAARVDGMNVLVPVNNHENVGYSVSLQAGLLQGDQLVAVASGSQAVPAGGTATASLMLMYPFGLQAVPANDRILPALEPIGTKQQ